MGFSKFMASTAGRAVRVIAGVATDRGRRDCSAERGGLSPSSASSRSLPVHSTSASSTSCSGSPSAARPCGRAD